MLLETALPPQGHLRELLESGPGELRGQYLENFNPKQLKQLLCVATGRSSRATVLKTLQLKVNSWLSDQACC